MKNFFLAFLGFCTSENNCSGQWRHEPGPGHMCRTSLWLRQGLTELLAHLYLGNLCFNLVSTVFSLSNMAAAGKKTLAHSELKRSLIGAFHDAFIRALSLFTPSKTKMVALWELCGDWEVLSSVSVRAKRWTEFRCDCLENCDCTVGGQRFGDSSPI